MKTNRITQVFLALMGLAFSKTGLESLINPQAVVANVGIVLDNASAASSMRAVYGGMHLVFGLFCFYGVLKKPFGPLLLITLYTIGFTIGRLTSIAADGLPNEFVITWLATEIICGGVAALLAMKVQVPSAKPALAS